MLFSPFKMTFLMESCICFTDIFIYFACFMMVSAIFNNISAILWRSVLLVEETTDLLQFTDKLYCIMSYTSPWSRFELTTSMVIGTDCRDSCPATIRTRVRPSFLFIYKKCSCAGYINNILCKKVDKIYIILI